MRKPVLESAFNKVYLKETPVQVFSGEICENLKNTYFEKHCERLFLRILQEKLLNSTSRFLHFNVYRLFKFSTVGSASQHGTLQQIMSNAASLYMTQLAGIESNNLHEVSKLIELKSISTT